MQRHVPVKLMLKRRQRLALLLLRLRLLAKPNWLLNVRLPKLHVWKFLPYKRQKC
jgi:hypothetical protein